MATKTLGVKFQVAGVKEAQAELNNLRSSLNRSYEESKQTAVKSLKLNKRIPTWTRRTSDFSPPSSPHSDSRDTTDNIVRLDPRSVIEIAAVLKSSRGENRQSDPITEIRNKGLVRGSFSSAGNNLRSIYKGFLESIGAGLGADFGEGLKKALEDDLDFSFKRRGEVTGKTAAYAVSEGGRGLRAELKTLFELFRKTNVKTTTPQQTAEDANEVRKSLVRLFSLLPTKLATGYRRAAVELEGLPRVDKLKDRDEHQANQFKPTTKKVVYGYGGFAGREGKAGFEIAEQMRQVADEATEIVGMDTGFTDLTVNFKKTTQWVLEALGTVASINVKGFNPDAIKGSAQIINDLDANPDLMATIVGHSAGGFPSEETVQILNLLGYGDRVKGVSAGTPNMKGRLDAPNFTRVMGEGDATMRKFEKGIDPVGLFADDAEILEGVDSHAFADYLQHERFLEAVFGKRVKSLIERYEKYLKDIARQASNNAKTEIETRIPGYKNFNLERKKDTATEFGENLRVISKKYRQAVKDNDLNLARELGENLLAQIQYLRRIYGDILEEGGENRSVSALLGNLTKIETEVTIGQPNLKDRGYDTKGLVNHLGDRLDGTAPNIVDGFVEGILLQLDRVEDAGAEIGDNLQSGTDKNLGIESPAKRYIKKGRQVVQGFVSGIKDGLKSAAEAGRNLGDATAQGTVDSGIDRGVDSVKSNLQQLFTEIGDRFPVLKRFRRVLVGIAGLFVAKLGLDFAVNILKRVGGESLRAAMAMETLDLSIRFASRNAPQGAAALEFISASAKKLSIDLLSAKDQYSKLLAAARNTSLEGGQINRVFTAFAETAANRGLGAGQQQQVFRALEQIINKRYLGREEVVQQLGDVFSGFEGLLSESLGVSSSQLGKMMENKELGLDVLPKVAAALEAQNAAVGSIDTAQKAQTRFNNALLESKVALGEILQPLQKFLLNLGTKAIEDFRGKLAMLFKLILTTGVVSLLNIFGKVNLLNLSTISLTATVEALTAALKKLWASKMAIAKALGGLILQYGLVIAAYKIWSSVISLSKNQYQDLNNEIDKLSDGIDRYKNAIKSATDEQSKFGRSKGGLKLNEGWQLPDNKFGNFLKPILGGDRLNLDNLVRNRWNGMLDRLDAYNSAASGGRSAPLKGRITTEAERRQSDFQAAVGDLNVQTDKLLFDAYKAFQAAEKITDLDKKIAEIQSKQETLLPGDRQAREQSLAKEREISEARDLELKILTNFQQQAQASIATTNNALETLEAGRADRSITQDVYDSVKPGLIERLDEAEKKLSDVNEIISDLSKTLSIYERKLKNSSIRLAGFIERRQLEASAERASIITEGVELSKGDRVIQLELDASSRRELTDFITEIEKNINENRDRLESAALSDGYKLSRQLAREQGITLDTAGIDDLLSKNISNQAKEALQHLKVLREDEIKLNQYREQLAQNIQTNRNSLIDFNRTINDYFFRINQQIKETQIEVLRVIDQIINTQIRNQLQSALSPNANSFVNQLISSTQSLLDQAASYAERVLGQRGARIQFATQERSLQVELQDFARNVGGASDALLEFEKRLRGGSEANTTTNSTINSTINSQGRDDESPVNTNSFASKTKQIAQRLGIDPHALMTIMLFESMGTLNPKVRGPNVPGQGRGRGLIQFMPATARGLGTSDAELASMTDIEQLDYVEKYFAQFKGNFGAGKLENLYAAVLAGNPLKVNASDGYTTAREGAKTMMRDFGDKALELLEAKFNPVSSSYFPILGMNADTARITSDYGWRNIFGRRDFHEGIDIAASGGTAVRAVNSGEVRHIKPLADQTQVGIETAKGVMEWFIHLGQNLEVSRGDRVTAGETIGYVAHTTQRARNAKVSTGDHLDYRVNDNGKWIDPKQYLANAGSSQPLVSRATAKTNQLTDKQEQVLDLKDALVQLEKEGLEISIANNLKSDRQKIDFNIVDSQFALDKLLDAGKDLTGQYDFQTAATEAAKSIRAVNTAFSDRGLQLSQEIIKYTDEINAINDLMSQAPSKVRMLRDAGKNKEADILTEKVAQAQLLLKPYQEILASLTNEYLNNTEAAETALNYVVELNKLKEQQFGLNKRSLLLTQKATIAEQRGTLEAQRKVKAHQEDLRLYLKINELRQQYAPGEYLDEAIRQEEYQSQVNQDNIRYDSQIAELELERELLEQQKAIGDKNAGFLSRYGFNFQADKIRRDNAIALENNRFQRELDKYQRDLKDQPELLEEMTRAATELNRVSLVSIENEFKSLGKAIEDNFISANQGFFTNFVSSGFDGTAQKEKAELDERLRYAEELNQLENQHSREPGKLAHLKNRARELNEEKLDKIRNEFNLFSRTVDLAKQAVIEFVKQLAVMAAQRAAAGFLSSILGSAIGGIGGGGVSAVGNDFGSNAAGVGAFFASEGATVGEDIKSRTRGLRFPQTREMSVRKISDRNTSILRRTFPGVAKAWNAEGKNPQLGVFHKNEELLSYKTGEAGRYQMLKRELGINPLNKILNYSEGGTIPDVGSNVLSGFNSSRPRIDLSGLSQGRRDRSSGNNKTINLHTTVVTPDADSFRLNEDQRNQDLMERLRRGI